MSAPLSHHHSIPPALGVRTAALLNMETPAVQGALSGHPVLRQAFRPRWEAPMGMVAFIVAAMLTLTVHDAGAQAFGQGDCFPPQNSFYVIGDAQWACGSLDPGISFYNFSGLQLEYTNCGAPPPSLPGSAVSIPLDGKMRFGFEAHCSGPDPDCGLFRCGSDTGYALPVSPALHVSFNHEVGSTRYFDIASD